MKIGAVIPVKDFADAKQRLAVALREAERRLLCEAMIQDVLQILSTVSVLAEIIVVTRDHGASSIAKRFGARVLSEPANTGQTTAVTRAAGVLASEGLDGLLQVPGDVPATTAKEIRSILKTQNGALGATFVPAHDGRGTNCILCTPPDALPFAFGHDSFGPHCEAARARGITFQVLSLAGLSLDIDTPADIRTFLAQGIESRTLDYLRNSGVAARLSGRQERMSCANIIDAA